MEDNNQEIDFSSQPLGVVSQEGEDIENTLNSEFAKNEELRKQKNGDSFASNSPAQVEAVPEEPLPDFISALPVTHKEDNAGEVPAQAVPMESAPQQDKPPAQEVASQKQEPVNHVAAAQPVKEEVPQKEEVPAKPEVPARPEVPTERKPEVVQESVKEETAKANDLPGQVNNVPDIYKTNQTNTASSDIPPEEKVSSVGLIFFILVVALAAGAVYLFKSGKADILFGENPEDYSIKSSESPTGDQTTENGLEVIRTYYSKETLYAVVDNASVTVTATGVVDLENRTSKKVYSGNLAGRYSKSMTAYCDYNAKICYSENMTDNTKWDRTEDNSVLYLGPDEAYGFLNTLGNLVETGENAYTIDIKVGDVLKLASSTESYTEQQKETIIKTEVFMEGGRIKRIKYDFTAAFEGRYQKVYGVLEYTEINKYGNVEIPDSVINSPM